MFTLHSKLVIWLSIAFGNLLQSEYNNGDKETVLFEEYRGFFLRRKSAGAWSSPLISIQCLRQELVDVNFYARFTCFRDVDTESRALDVSSSGVRRSVAGPVVPDVSEDRCSCISSPKLSERSV